MKEIVLAFLIGSLITSYCFADDKDQELHRAQRVLKKLESHISAVSTKALM